MEMMGNLQKVKGCRFRVFSITTRQILLKFHMRHVTFNTYMTDVLENGFSLRMRKRFV